MFPMSFSTFESIVPLKFAISSDDSVELVVDTGAAASAVAVDTTTVVANDEEDEDDEDIESCVVRDVAAVEDSCVQRCLIVPALSLANGIASIESILEAD